MPEESQHESRLARFMNERRLDLGLRWDDVARRAEVSAEGLRALRRDGSVPRELTQRGVEKALGWRRGSVLRVIGGGDPEVLEDQPDHAGLIPECRYETEILETPGGTPEAKRDMILGHRLKKHRPPWCRPYGEQEQPGEQTALPAALRQA
jgi:hypothetical protein